MAETIAIGNMRESSMLDEGVCAEVKVGSEHLRLFVEQNAQGVQASVYNVNAKNWIAPSESVDTIEHAGFGQEVSGRWTSG
jgi:hypothetical protein